MRKFLAALCVALLLAGCGNSSSSGPSSGNGGSTSSGGSGSGSGKSTYASTCPSNDWIGNKKSKVLHRPGSGGLPAPKNQVCFTSEAAGEAAGYHPAR